MKLLYVLFILSIVLILALLVLSFIYFEKTRHQHFYYSIQINEIPRGEVEVDRYVTQDHIVYKSKEFLPYDRGLNRKNIKINFERKTQRLKDFEKEKQSDSTKELYYLERMPQGLAFLAVAKSKFAHLDKIIAKDNAMPFSHLDLVTWIPFIKQYNYKIGGSQFFTTIKCDPEISLPRLGAISLTSIRDEYIDVDNKKVKTECLVLKETGSSQMFVWVAKRGHNIIAVDIPDEKERIQLTEQRQTFRVENYALKSDRYGSKKIYFLSRGKEIKGTLTRPVGEGVFPAIILIRGEAACEEENFGLFTDLAHFLALKGYVVLHYNMHPLNGNARFQTISVEDEWAAMDAAVGFLKEYRFVDINRIGIIAHSDANYILPYYLKGAPDIKSWIMLSPKRLDPIAVCGLNLQDDDKEDEIQLEEGRYEKGIAGLNDKTLEIVEASSGGWKSIMGRRVFLQRIRDILQLNPLEDLNDITIPILVLEGKMDKSYSTEFFKLLEKAIKNPEYDNRSLVLFRELNHYFGETVEHKHIKKHYEIDKEVLKSITGWLGKRL